MTRCTYALVTPARNEAALIGATLAAVVAQTQRPQRWVIVSDGSTDATDEIVARHAAEQPWIELLRLPEHRDRSFAAKAHVFNAGWQRVRELNVDVIGNLDADITFEADYFERLMEKFAADPQLGVGGTHYVEGGFHSFNDSYMAGHHVNGGCQMFRKAALEAIGGYTPIRGGGVDWVAVTSARMRGWKTQSFADRVFHHHRKIGTAETNEVVSRFRYGKKDWFLGGHPLWQLCRCGFQLFKRPYVVGGAAIMAGYLWCALFQRRRPIPPELVRFHRGEQMARLKSMFGGGRRRSEAAAAGAKTS